MKINQCAWVFVLIWNALFPLCAYPQAPDAIVRAKIEEVFKAQMHDPSSYEFVSIGPGLTITYKHIIASKREAIEDRIESNRWSVDSRLESLSPRTAELYLDNISELKTVIETDYLLLKKIDSVESILGEKVNMHVAYNYPFKCRGKNVFGARVAHEYLVQVKAPTLEIMNIASGPGNLITDFGEFPGYQEIMEEQPHLRRLVSHKVQVFVDSISKANANKAAVRSEQLSGNEARSDNRDNDQEVIYTVVEQQPEFPGGYAAMARFLRKNMQYPAGAKREGIAGTVYVSFVVDKHGAINEIAVVRGIDPDCDKEATRLISTMPSWVPGRQSGKAVSVRYMLPIKFSPK